MKKILIVDDGIEFDSILVRKKPFGGAEIAFVSLIEALAKLKKFKITVFNNCLNTGEINNVFWKKLDKNIYQEDFDILIVNRGDKFLNFKPSCKKRLFWIHNPAKYLLKYRYLSKLILNKFIIIFSSEYHLNTYPSWAPAKDRIIIPYGVENYFFSKKKNIRSIPKPNAIFTSNPLRGLDWLLEVWEKKIFPLVDGAKLNLYSGTSNYGSFGEKHFFKVKKILERAKELKKKGVSVHKPINRKQLFKKIKESRIFLYAGSDEETFCMSAAESQMLLTPGVVKNFGCMHDRIINGKTGYVCDTDEDFCKKSIKLLCDDKLWKQMHSNLSNYNHHFSWEEIAKKWEKVIDLNY